MTFALAVVKVCHCSSFEIFAILIDIVGEASPPCLYWGVISEFASSLIADATAFVIAFHKETGSN